MAEHNSLWPHVDISVEWFVFEFKIIEHFRNPTAIRWYYNLVLFIENIDAVITWYYNYVRNEALLCSLSVSPSQENFLLQEDIVRSFRFFQN